MHYLSWFSFPYSHYLQSQAHHLVLWVMGLSLAFAMLDLILPAPDRHKGRLTLILIAVNTLLYQSQYLTGRQIYDLWAVVAAGSIIALYGIIYHRSLKTEWAEYTVIPEFWSGLVIIAGITAVKLVELQTWPPFLNEYSANTGVWGMESVEGKWPEFPFQGRGFDLRGGGASPLMLPVMWVTMKWFGVNSYSVRLSEVIGSTVLLLIFWDFVRVNVPGIWSRIALIVFGMSPWHLAQSRMGTFFSISTAVSIGMLWSADRIYRSRSTGQTRGWWILLGSFAGCIGWCYAPMKVLYLFFFAVTAGMPFITRNRQKRRFQGPILGIIAFTIFFIFQFQGLENIRSMFQSHFGNLATDNPVWRKTTEDIVKSGIQPVDVILSNIRRNAVEWTRVTFQEPTILRLYPGALMMSMVLAVLFLRWHPVISLYFFCGILPPLLIFPLHRRSLIIWPLIYLTAVLLFREIAVMASALSKRRGIRTLIHSSVLICITLIMLHGLDVWVSTWSIVKDHSYFGPAKRLEAMDLATKIMDSHSIVFINPWVHVDVITITLYERNLELGGNRLRFASASENTSDLEKYLDPGRPTAFFYFDLDRQEWLKNRLISKFPGGILQEFRNPEGRRELLYSVYTVGMGDPFHTSSDFH